ncbi:restriction endonuclease subunit S [Acinetobacter beijerinckii]|uniref:restriction endonuclease subunit S n=1 Tax=Acinetobacter beijerinckii TaxID=262668 RepID=UPI0024066717|nr:restriction endonuclease subunit S [Acinetobacter beijerinckii]
MSQEVVKGYKQTEIGSIPLDWQLKELRDVCIKIQDGNYGAFYPKSSEFISYGVPFLTSKVLGKAGNINFNKVDYISNEKHKVLLKAHLELNDVLFTNRGASVGAIGYVDARISNGNIGPQLTLLRVNSFVDSLYLFQIMKSSWVQKQILSQDSGSAMNFFGVGATGKFKLPIPDNINEQKIIANILTDVDALICELEKLIAKKQAIKTATMQQLLTGKTRLPQFSLREDGTKKGYKQSELGKIPEDWEIDKIGNVVSITTGDKNTQDKVTDGLYPFFVRSQQVEKINSFSFDGEAVLTAGDGVGTGKIFHYINGKFDFHQRVYLMHNFFEKLDGYYFYIFFSNHFYERIMSMTAKSSVDSVRREMIADMPIILPTKQEQTAIAKILSDMDSEIQALEKRLVKTRQIKQGMMQELLTGKTRLLQGTVNT